MNGQLTTLLQSQAPDAFHQYVNCQIIDQVGSIICFLVTFGFFLVVALWFWRKAKKEKHRSDIMEAEVFAGLFGMIGLTMLALMSCAILSLIKITTNPKGYLLSNAVEKIQ